MLQGSGRCIYAQRMIATASHAHGPLSVLSLALAVLVLGAFPAAATNYFIRQNGNDDAEGTSSNAAWRTVERVNRARLRAGDRVQFQSAQSFAGNLWVAAENGGTSNSPVTIGSFGEGRATILAGKANGITVENTGGIAIENLVVAGSGRTNNAGYGILCENTLTNGQRLSSLRLDNVEARDFGNLGILVTGTHAGFEHVLVTNCVMHDNLRGGMEVAGRLPWDTSVYAHADVRVSHCQAFNNTGDPAYFKNHSGSGIVLYQIDGALMDYCTAWNNGNLCPSSGGGVGLWTCASRGVTIEHCESFGNRTSGGDGGGFDIDGGSIDCVLQYNYSHDNDGPGLMVYSYPYRSFSDRGSVVRFNISENDSRKGRRYAGLWVRTDGKEITGIEIYNNTVVVGPWTDQAALISAHGIEARLCNNIFVGAGLARPLRVNQPQNQVRFENNLYWRTDGPTEILWGQQTFTNLQEWREQTGQELIGGQPAGFFADPDLSSHPAGFHPGQCVGLGTVRAFHPLARSPALAGGLDLHKLFGLDTGRQDLLGPLPPENKFPLGAIATRALE